MGERKDPESMIGMGQNMQQANADGHFARCAVKTPLIWALNA